MQSEFRLARQQNYRGHFTCVTVYAEIISNGVEVIEAIREPVDIDECEVNRKIDSSWIDAVVLGVQKCAEILISQGKISGCRVEIRRVIGTIVDTAEEDLICAGALATWQALNQNEQLPTFYFENNKWNIKY